MECANARVTPLQATGSALSVCLRAADGRKVYEQVSNWRVGAKATKDEWSKHGQMIREQTKANNATAASVKELGDSKKAQAAATRKEDEEKEAERQRQKALREKEARAAADAVRAATSDEVTDSLEQLPCP